MYVCQNVKKSTATTSRYLHKAVGLDQRSYCTPGPVITVKVWRSSISGPSDVLSRCHGFNSDVCPVCLPKYWLMGVLGSDLSAAFKKIFHLRPEEVHFGGEPWLADFFPSSGSSLIMIGWLGLYSFSFSFILTVVVSRGSPGNRPFVRKKAFYTSG